MRTLHSLKPVDGPKISDALKRSVVGIYNAYSECNVRYLIHGKVMQFRYKDYDENEEDLIWYDWERLNEGDGWGYYAELSDFKWSMVEIVT
jgi:hypothetical protein